MHVGRSWQWACLRGMICRSRARCRSFNTCSLTKRHALPIWSASDGATGLSVRTAGWVMHRGMCPRDLACFVAVIAAATQASPLALSWSVRTRRCPYGSGRPIWSPVRRRACRPCSSNGNSGCRAMRRPSRSFISCARAGDAPTRTGSAASLTNTSRPMRSGLAGVHEGRVEAFITSAWWLRRSRSVSVSPAPSSIREGAAAMRAASGWPWFQTAAPVRWAAW